MNWSMLSLFSAGVLLASAPAWAQPFCGAMTKDKAAVILGCSVGEVQHRSSEELHTCSFSKDLLHSVHYALYQEKDADSAQKAMTEVAQGLQMLVVCEPVEGLGDAGFSCDGDRAKRLLVRKGSAWVDVISPADFEQKKMVATAVFEQ
ncbi:MAG: hypothetical protein AB7U29_17575 [Desulfobulbus sp.]